MLGSIGLPELIFIFVLALLIFGPKRLPEIGRTIGKGLSEFRRASNDLKRTIDTEILAADDERRLHGPPATSSILTGPARALSEVNSALQAVVAAPVVPASPAASESTPAPSSPVLSSEATEPPPSDPPASS